MFNIRFQIVHFVPQCLFAFVPYEDNLKKQSQFAEGVN